MPVRLQQLHRRAVRWQRDRLVSMDECSRDLCSACVRDLRFDLICAVVIGAISVAGLRGQQ